MITITPDLGAKYGLLGYPMSRERITQPKSLEENLMHVRTVAVVALSITLGLSLTACGAGNDAATSHITQVTDGVDGSVTSYGSDLKVNSMLLVAQPDGSAVLVGSIVNRSVKDDVLLGVAAGGITATLSQNELPLAPNAPLLFSGDSANASAVIPGLNAAVGTRIKLHMFFGIAGALTLDVIVRERDAEYALVGAPTI
ncbi:MAG: hypothetical protein Q8L08_05720 [Candidatus Nanopelagicaceae bacterium]|nr:hypothetical protein [Candidatus Nanopelagicaceae bacterium]